MPRTLVPVPPDDIPRFDELYAVSDLHMGGLPDFQIFNASQELALLIDHVRELRAPEVAFVINGDTVDFLAESDSKPFDPAGAARKLARIGEEIAFRLAWEALGKFVREKGRHLIITLGNHDLELALPWVRTRLLSMLAGDDSAARGRITLAFDGSGFLCRVGDATVLCLHGNEVDDWNLTDHEAIRRIARDVMRGREIEPWIPNAGTQLVIQVINDLKRDFPFVDLLKPELEAVVPTLLALAPDRREGVGAAYSVLGRLGWDKLRHTAGFLGANEEVLTGFPGPAVGLTTPAGFSDVGARMRCEGLLAEAEDRLLRGVEPISLVQAGQGGEQLGLARAALRLARGHDRRDVLREALEQLQKDRSFEWSQEDGTFRALDEEIGEVDFILAGHTHLERALHRRRRRGWYFNSGTWARLMRLEPRVLASPTEFRRVYTALAAGRMVDLDQVQGLMLRRRTVIAIQSDNAGTRGELRRWEAADGKLEVVDPRACFMRS